MLLLNNAAVCVVNTIYMCVDLRGQNRGNPWSPTDIRDFETLFPFLIEAFLFSSLPHTIALCTYAYFSTFFLVLSFLPISVYKFVPFFLKRFAKLESR